VENLDKAIRDLLLLNSEVRSAVAGRVYPANELTEDEVVFPLIAWELTDPINLYYTSVVRYNFLIHLIGRPETKQTLLTVASNLESSLLNQSHNTDRFWITFTQGSPLTESTLANQVYRAILQWQATIINKPAE